MFIYHEIRPEALPTALAEGLVRTSQGAKSEDPAILKTNSFLDKHCPDHLRAAGLSRRNNIYGYIGSGSSIIDIQNGQKIPLQEKQRQNNLALVRLEVDPRHCWISDLDKYDAVKDAIMRNTSIQELIPLSNDYWNSLQPLKDYSARIRRPEVMIICDISPLAIHEVN
jgi:hypothetical protein